MKPKTEKSIEITITIKNPYGFSSKEFGTFIPYKLAIKVGNINIIEMDVIRFITIFKLYRYKYGPNPEPAAIRSPRPPPNPRRKIAAALSRSSF